MKNKKILFFFSIFVFLSAFFSFDAKASEGDCVAKQGECAVGNCTSFESWLSEIDCGKTDIGGNPYKCCRPTCPENGGCYDSPSECDKRGLIQSDNPLDTCIGHYGLICCVPKADPSPAGGGGTQPPPSPSGGTGSGGGIVPSQCVNGDSNCNHDNDAAVLTQCKKQYDAGKCGSVQDYLNAMKSECNSMSPKPDVNCDKIAAEGYYGTEAVKFATIKAGDAGDGIPLLTSGACPVGMEPEGKLCFPAGTGLSEKPVVGIATGILNWMLGIFGSLGILTFVVSGIFYLTAAGDADQEKKAKNAMNMGIIGIIVGLSGFVIIKALDTILNAGV